MNTSATVPGLADELDDLVASGLLVDEADWLLSGEAPVGPAGGAGGAVGCAEGAGCADIFTSGAAHDAAVDEFERMIVAARRAAASQYVLIAQVLADAQGCPDPWCGPDPTHDPAWRDARGRSAGAVRAERREMAVRAAVCDLAVRSRLSETMIRARGVVAAVLQERCPHVWAAFASGDVDERNAATAATAAQTLPDDRAVWDEFDRALQRSASRLAPGRFRTRARVVRERVHPETVDDRHARARDARGVWVEPAADGMACLQVVGSAADVCAAYARADRFARHLRAADDEMRTLAQLRADVVLDVLNRGGIDQTAGTPAGKPTVAVTVPVLTLLGRSDRPAVLDGYGPIDTETARRLAGEASGWVRVLTHPVSGTVLDVDRTVYRVPRALRRWLGVRDALCTFPGCGRLAAACDMDHAREWRHGGATRASNLGPLCTHHHRVKTETLWAVHIGPREAPSDARDRTRADVAGGPRVSAGGARWTSPSGYDVDSDPPPW